MSNEQITRVSEKFLQYFGNMRHNLAALNAFTKVVKMTNHTGLNDISTFTGYIM